MRLLLIEDDRPIARGIQSSLEQTGFTVDMVHDGIFAEQAFAQNRHDLIILDLGLPGLDGGRIEAVGPSGGARSTARRVDTRQFARSVGG